MAIGTYISIITSNVNGLNAPTKRHRLAEWIQKQDPDICCLQETDFRPQDTYRLKVREWKNIFHAVQFSSVHFSCSVVSDSLQPHESQLARPPCPSKTYSALNLLSIGL